MSRHKFRSLEIFRAYDVRGVYPDELDEHDAARIAEISLSFFKKGKILVAHDARKSSPILYKSIVDLIEKEKKSRFKLIKAGLMTTPCFYFLVNKFKLSGGIMVTASHDPKNYNGMKIVREKAIPISGDDIKKRM